ncbi:hypothetical protein FMEXI_9794 [Fusarium mexicanum]|uniref:Uncharacterized protein n=1 Tax=Fusarium mexicanum TaxID=751941 RepID=A0A8H5IIL0_9HYPO|nr:hypothetical protein FMEXI_9794 [Fusarium mexicanum]
MERQSYELLRRGAPVELENKQSPGESAWPPEPRPLPQSFWASISSIISFLPLLMLPIPFAVLLVFMARLEGKPLSRRGDAIFQGMGLASTLWPIAFAAILGSLARTIALYRAERGTNLGTLGILLGSQTLMSTLTSAFNLRIVSHWAILLIILWSLSPLGGQAVLRAIHVTFNTKAQPCDLMYSPATNSGIPFDKDRWSISTNSPHDWSPELNTAGSDMSTIKVLFGAALSAPNSLGQAANGSSDSFGAVMQQIGNGTASLLARTDPWGNFRVPQITSLPGYSSFKPYKWLDVPTDQLVTYESLIGIPLWGIPIFPGNLTFEIPASYATLKCSRWFDTVKWLEANPGILKSHKKDDIHSDMGESENNSNHSQVYMDTPNNKKGFNFSAKNITSKGLMTHGTFVFGNFGHSTVCDIGHIYVDVDVICERPTRFDQMACKTRRICHSPSRPFPKVDHQLVGHGAHIFLCGLPFLASSSSPGLKSPMENYLADPAKGIGRLATPEFDYIGTEYTKLPLPVFAERLAIIINTALRLYWSPYTILDMEGVPVSETDHYGNVTSILALTSKVYGTRKVWMATAILSLAIMFSAAILTVGLRLVIRAPDFLTHVAALTRDSAYMDLAPGGSMLTGDERARLLKDLPLKIMDIEPDNAVGYIALSDKVGNTEERLGNDGRVYR